ncbi:hypothetical protein PLEI_3437 [Photobacterium leiognathi lrivu.4.1]|uniref:Uncharacterized protein n=1 Tax=Photobacterium leiognathi lrivu.4.1 TaxID=1248232 RepID=V5F8N6_PHOLE|nr:hypothetical protein PLEI_3437 [Photobacterium leiognathi lrivu.4.1]
MAVRVVLPTLVAVNTPGTSKRPTSELLVCQALTVKSVNVRDEPSE